MCWRSIIRSSASCGKLSRRAIFIQCEIGGISAWTSAFAAGSGVVMRRQMFILTLAA
jgi:hypothetical protein